MTTNTCRRLGFPSGTAMTAAEWLLAWVPREVSVIRSANARVGRTSLLPFPLTATLSYPSDQTSSTTQCPRIQTIRLRQPLPRTSGPSLRPLWRNTKSGRRKTSPLMAWPPRSSPATLPMPFSPCFKPKSRRLILLRAPTKGGQGCWTRPSPYCTHSPGS